MQSINPNLEKIKVYKRMAKLLRNSKHEEQHRRHQWMALSQNPYVYRETREETKDKSAKPNQDGSAGGLGMAGRKQPLVSYRLLHD